MRALTLLIVTFFISLSPDLHAQLYYPSFDKITSVTQARTDLEFIKRFLEKGHPNLYRYISRADFNKKMDSLKRSFDKPLTQLALRNAILSVLTAIGDGHLSLRLNVSDTEIATTRTATLKTYPIEQFNYQVLQGRWFVSATSEPNALISPGEEILSINGITTAKMLADFCSVLSSDGYNQTFKSFLLNQGLIPELFTQFYGLKESLSFKVKSNNATRVVQVNAGPLRKNIPYKTGQAVVDFKLLPGASAYLKLGTFSHMQGGAATGITGPDPYLSVFQRLRSSGATSLILDLRNNTGGEYITAVQLFAYLIDRPSFFAKVPPSILNDKLKTPDERLKYGSATPIIPQPLRFKGSLYVLINGGTFSAASLLAANLQAMGGVQLIGEESGGGRNCFTAGLITEEVAPNSRMILRFGSIPMETPLMDKVKGRGVMPNSEVSYSIMEYLSGRDKELEWVKNEIAMGSER